MEQRAVNARRSGALLLVMFFFMVAGSAIQAQEFSPSIELGSLDGSDGFILEGASAENFTGVSVSAAGDFNGDGIADLLIGADRANDTTSGGNSQGFTYLLYGNREGFPDRLRLGELTASQGIRFVGEADDESGHSVSGAGDFNGNGLADIIIGAWNAAPNDRSSGRSYVVYGSDQPFALSQPLVDIGGDAGLKFDGEVKDDFAGVSVSGIGDFNDNGFDDVIVGAYRHHANGHFWAGSAYVLFGGMGELSVPLQRTDLDGSNGFKINGEMQSGLAGSSVGGARDINGDGYDDIIIGAPGASNNGTNSGSVYVLFGQSGGFEGDISLAHLNGNNGFRLDGAPGEMAGASVAGAGDINGDGIADIIFGAPDAKNNGTGSGSTYVVFGRQGGFPHPLDLSELDGTDGFRIDGEGSGDASGSAVAGNLDLNGDGIADIVIGAPNAKTASGRGGAAYVVFGSRDSFPPVMQLADLDGSNGFKLNGEVAGDSAGISVSGAGDINGDGRDDLIIGAYQSTVDGKSEAGRAYVVFGRGNPQANPPGVQDPVVIFTDNFEP